jgi:hypothetical protein
MSQLLKRKTELGLVVLGCLATFGLSGCVTLPTPGVRNPIGPSVIESMKDRKYVPKAQNYGTIQSDPDFGGRSQPERRDQPAGFYPGPGNYKR